MSTVRLPSDFLSAMQRLLPTGQYADFCAEMERPAQAFIRLNGRKTDAVPIGEEIPWCRDGYALPERPDFTFDPLLHAGAYYVQEQSSMFLAHVLRQLVSEPVLMLDLCAAPGGKSTLARAVLPEGSILLANEPVRNRAQVLAENIAKWGHPDVIVTNNLPADYQHSPILADILLLDVPCSGEGMFRKDPENIGEWSLQKVQQCQQLQRQIAEQAWNCLKEGGLLIYSTCTFNTAENEENVRWICQQLGAETVDVPIPPDWHIGGSLLPGFDGPVFRFIPGVTCGSLPQGEGLFMAVMRKMSAASGSRNPRQQPLKTQRCAPEVRQMLCNPDEFLFLRQGDSITAVPEHLINIYAHAQRQFRLLHAGIPLCTAKGRDFVPQQALALSTECSPKAFPCVELPWETAVNYLRREAVTLPADTPKGICLVSYQGLPLGFVKHLGNRSNNLYPTEWRIRSTHLPPVPPAVIK